MAMVRFFMPMDPPTSTAQEVQHTYNPAHKKIQTYKPPNLQRAEDKLMGALSQHKPKTPLEGPIQLIITWYFPRFTTMAKKDYPVEQNESRWREKKPDLDNMTKLLQDCMTKLGFWKDDRYIVQLLVTKIDTGRLDPAGIMIEAKEIDWPLEEGDPFHVFRW